MRRFIRNRIVIFTFAAWVAYWPFALLVPHDVMLELINGLVAALSVGLVVAYMPGVWSRLRENPYLVTGADMLVLGIVVVQFAVAGLFIWSWAFRVLGQPQWMIDHPFRGWFLYLLSLGGALHLMASDVGPINYHIPDRGWMRVGIMTALGFGVGVLVMALEKL